MSKKLRTDLSQQAERIALGVARAAIPREDAAADDLLAGGRYWPEWAPGPYGLHAVCRHEGQVWRCVQEHVAQADWKPAAGSALWAAYHARERALARPWVRPYGVHDAYQTGEYMVWTDGALYQCIQESVVWGPDVAASAWRLEASGAGPAAWAQPSGGHDAYGLGDLVRHQGTLWRSLVAGNVWEPGVYGWEPAEA